jgi:hypothetical protein
MALTQLARERWQAFFDIASRGLTAQVTKVEVTGLQLGDRIAADHVPLLGVSYEPKNDTLTLHLEGLEHRVVRPRAIHVEQDGTVLRSFEAVDEDGVHHIVQFTTALELPAP